METIKNTNANYSVEIEIPKSPEVVFYHVIALSKWWPEEFEGENLQIHKEFILRTGDGHFSKNKVIEFIPNRKVVWLTTDSLRKADNFDWTGTKFIFEINPIGNNTTLKFTYDGVVLENEIERLAQICDICIKVMFYDFIMKGKVK